MTRLLCVTLMVILGIGESIGQKAPIVFGKVPMEDLRMTVYEHDTTAPAVVLCDYGWFDKTTFEFTRLLRIKILRKEGYPFADRRYLTMSNPVIRGVTSNIAGDEIEKVKLAASSIYVKKLSTDIYETSFAMPNATVGSVIDIEFNYPGLPYRWDFQWLIPVLHSELILQESEYLDYSKNFFGYVPLSVTEPNRWVAKKVPAFKPEPYMDTPENYTTKFEIELQRITFPGYFKTFCTSWENINDILLVDNSFPAEATGSLCLSALVDELKKSGLKDDELLKAAFEKVKKIKYNGEERLYVSTEGLCSKYKLGAGNSAEVNLSLIQVLNRLGFKTYPVVLSTRSNGMLSQYAPSLFKLNYVVAAVPSGNSFRLLDATEEYMPFTLLPDRCINGNGRLVNNAASQWIPLVSSGTDNKTVTYDLKFEDDMSLSGTITIDAVDYAAYDIRKSFSEFNSKEEYARHVEKTYPGITITEISASGLDDIYAPLQIMYKAKLEGLTTQIDDEVYLTPMLLEALTENPFANPERVYPVSYSRKVERQVILKLSLKDGMTPVVIPGSSAGKTKSSSLVYNYNAINDSDKIEVTYKFSINSLTFTQDKYRELREFYNQIVKKHSEPLIIKAS